MQDLRVIGVENGALLAASDDGVRFRIPIDELMQSKLRQSIPEANAGRKMSPREIQTQIRSGMSAQDVSNLTGVPLDYITRFEGPVLAEREFVVTSALNVAVQTAVETDPFTQGMTFGSAIRHRLVALSAVNERWASWKEEGSGWVVKLSFTANEIDHDARWAFEPKKNSLAPLNNEAVALSQQGDTPSALMPRLRAVNGVDVGGADAGGAAAAAADGSAVDIVAPSDHRGISGQKDRDSALTSIPSEPDRSRFDSGAFDVSTHDNDDDVAVGDAVLSRFAPGGASTTNSTTTPANITPTNQTADLLEALRRRRGERESANYREEDAPTGGPAYPGSPAPAEVSTTPPQTSGIRLVDVPLEKYLADEPNTKATAPQPTAPTKTARKGRTAMPSWDDIVFGARPDDLP